MILKNVILLCVCVELYVKLIQLYVYIEVKLMVLEDGELKTCIQFISQCCHRFTIYLMTVFLHCDMFFKCN